MNIISFSLASVAALALFAAPVQAQTGTATTANPPVNGTVAEARSSSDENESPAVYSVRLTSGVQAGQTITIGGAGQPVSSVGVRTYRVGDRVVLDSYQTLDGVTEYVITDYQRQRSLWWLVALFVVTVVWLGRWRGLRSLVGLAFSFLVIVGWMVPLISQGYAPVPITILGGSAVLLVSFIVTEGFGRRTWAAVLGTVLTMVAISLLSDWAISFSQLTGNNSEEAFYLQTVGRAIVDVRGLLLAGFIIGSLGILDDIAISQVAVVGELRAAGSSLKPWQLYAAAMRVGRSHMAAIVNTLVLAYAGVALPLLVLFSQGGQPAGFVFNSEIVATEVVRTIVGTIGLALALPLTTLFAVWLKVRSEHESAHGHGHSHLAQS